MANIGLQAKSTSCCNQIRRIRYGEFTLQHALIMKDINVENVIQNIAICKPLLSYQKLARRVHLLESNRTPQQHMLETGNKQYLT